MRKSPRERRKSFESPRVDEWEWKEVRGQLVVAIEVREVEEEEEHTAGATVAVVALVARDSDMAEEHPVAARKKSSWYPTHVSDSLLVSAE